MLDLLEIAHEHQQWLRVEAAQERLSLHPRLRHTFAALLHRAADWLDPKPFVGTAASRA